MTDIYLCGTFRTDQSREFNKELEKIITNRGYTCYLPQRDSEQRGDKQKTFSDDVAGIEGARLVLAVGAELQSANWGFEIGYAFHSKKPVIILTDKTHAPDLMTGQAANELLVVEDTNNLDSYLENLFTHLAHYLK